MLLQALYRALLVDLLKGDEIEGSDDLSGGLPIPLLALAQVFGVPGGQVRAWAVERTARAMNSKTNLIRYPWGMDLLGSWKSLARRHRKGSVLP